MSERTVGALNATTTAGAAIAAYEADLHAKGLSAGTSAKYVEIVRAFAGWTSSGLLSATHEDIVLWLHDRPHQLSPRTSHVYMTALHSFFTWAAGAGIVTVPATARLRHPRSRERGIDAGELVDAAVFREYARTQERRNLSARTMQSSRDVLRAFAGWMRPRSVFGADSEDVESWLDSRRLSPRSRSAYLTTLSVFFAWAVRTERMASNPVADIARPRKERLVPRPIAEADLVRAISQAPPRMAAWLSLAAYMGLRCQEIAGLRREDLLIDRPDPVLIVSKPKGGRQRILPMNAHVEAALRRCGLPTHGYVFESVRRMPFEPVTVSGYIAEYLHGLGIAATAHQLRHLFGTTIYAATKDIRIAQEMLGHADVSTTAIYVAINPHQAAAVMREMTYGVGK